MSVKALPTGKFIEGQEIVAFRLQNSKGTKVNIFNYGVIISQFIVRNRSGAEQDIVLGFDSIEGYLNKNYQANYPYLGAVIGRYANRIDGAQFTIDGISYQLAENNGPVCLHGGFTGFDKKIWTAGIIGDNEVEFSYLSRDREEGFPGNLSIGLTIKLTDNNELVLNYAAKADKDTPVNLTHHSYFNLLPDGGQVGSHKHTMPASFYLEQDENFATTGKFLPVKGTGLDFTSSKPIGQDWLPGTGYDQSFVLDKPHGELALASSTESPDGNLTLEIFTTEPIAHFYTAKYLNVSDAKNGKAYRPFEGFCVETQHHPNAVNIPGFPETVLKAGALYCQETIYRVS